MSADPMNADPMSADPEDGSGFDPVQTINDYADYYGVPPDLAQAVLQRESGGNHYDRDGKVLTSSRGYRGLMQMHPITAAGLGLGFNADDPEENVHAGLKYLGQNLRQFDANQALLAGYHSGSHRAVAALSDPGDIRTKSYVKSILGSDYGGYWHEGTGDDPSGPGNTFSVKLSQVNAPNAAQSGESDQPQGGNANLKLPLNSFQQMLQRMLASKDETTSSDSGEPVSVGAQQTVDNSSARPSGYAKQQQTSADAIQTPYLSSSRNAALLAASNNQAPAPEPDTYAGGTMADDSGGVSRETQSPSPAGYGGAVDPKQQQPAAGAGKQGTTVPVDLGELIKQVDSGKITVDEFLKKAQEEFGKKLGFEVAEQEALRAQYEPQGWNPFELVYGVGGATMTPSQALRFARDRLGVINVYVSPRNQEFYDAFRKARPISPSPQPQVAARRQDQPDGQAARQTSDEIWETADPDPWSGLTPEEQDIIDGKLKRAEGQSAQRRFNELVTQEGDTKDNVIAIKNLIDVAGGHTKSQVWKLIDSIDQVTGPRGGQPLVHIIIRKDKDGNPLRKEFAAAFDAEMDGNNKKYIVNDWLDKLINRRHKLDSIRQRTEYSTDYPIHFTSDLPETPERYFVHFDPASPYFRTSQCPKNQDDNGCLMSEVITAGLSHYLQSVTAAQVREYLKKTGQTHEE